jgi:hypothetical protein
MNWNHSRVWVVESLWADAKDQRWSPTVSVGLNRSDGRRKLAQWRERNPDDRFRLVPYRRARAGDQP